MSGLLEPSEHHDLNEATNVKTRRGRIKTNVARHYLLAGEGVERSRVGQLVNVPALIKEPQQRGFECAHNRRAFNSVIGHAQAYCGDKHGFYS